MKSKNKLLKTLPPLVTCRECGYTHRALVCPICKVMTPHYAVLTGKP